MPKPPDLSGTIQATRLKIELERATTARLNKEIELSRQQTIQNVSAPKDDSIKPKDWIPPSATIAAGLLAFGIFLRRLHFDEWDKSKALHMSEYDKQIDLLSQISSKVSEAAALLQEKNRSLSGYKVFTTYDASNNEGIFEGRIPITGKAERISEINQILHIRRYEIIALGLRWGRIPPEICYAFEIDYDDTLGDYYEKWVADVEKSMEFDFAENSELWPVAILGLINECIEHVTTNKQKEADTSYPRELERYRIRSQAFFNRVRESLTKRRSDGLAKSVERDLRKKEKAKSKEAAKGEKSKEETLADRNVPTESEEEVVEVNQQ